MSGSQKFLWPQENGELMRKRTKKVHPKWREIQFALEAYAAFRGLGNFRKLEVETMRLMNGENTEVLADKYKFLQLCASLGYRIPKQILVRAGENEEAGRKEFEKTFTEDGFGFYIKPEGGFVGKGIKIVKTRQDVVDLLPKIAEDTVIEENINIDKEFRYILYVDPDGNRWHLVFQKVRPEVTGDGKSSIFELIIKKSEIPWKRKWRLFGRNWKILGKVLSKGEIKRLANIGIPEAGMYGRLPNASEMAALDLFGSKLIADLEKSIGHGLPILCFDLGVLKSLNEELTLAQIKKIVTPFECQMPFSPYAHFKFIPHGFGPMIEFYRMLLSDMNEVINRRLEKENI